MINQIIKISGNLLLNNPKLNDRLLNYKKDSLRIVYYHMVSNKENKTFYFENKSINPEEFRNHIKFLKSKYEIISLQEAHNLIKLKKEMINKLVLTFDDGFKENYTIIAPILKEENITATFYLMSDFIDNKKLMWRNVILAALNKTKENKQGLINKITKEFKLISIKKNETFLEWSYRT
ncbi:MAG: polysaccharide deacetylase family protein [Polaribacter sp.]